MKKIAGLLLGVGLLTFSVNSGKAQSQLSSLLNKVTGKASTSTTSTSTTSTSTTSASTANTSVSTSTTNTAVTDLLTQSAKAGIGNLGVTNGFMNSIYKILMPPDVRNASNTLTKLGLGSVVTNAQTQMNHAAEQAVALALPIFTNAITSISITDAMSLVTGGDNAITNYFQQKTSAQLLAAFTPVIQQTLDKNGATKSYAQIVNTYNKVPLVKKLDPDLTNYVATQAINAMFSQMATAEKNIRTNPIAQTTSALQQVFGKN